MATLTAEILTIKSKHIDKIQNAIEILNSRQNVFEFRFMKDRELEQYDNKMFFYRTSEIYDLIEDTIIKIKGYHPNIICFVDKQLNGKVYSNLFGSFRDTKESNIEKNKINLALVNLTNNLK